MEHSIPVKKIITTSVRTDHGRISWLISAGESASIDEALTKLNDTAYDSNHGVTARPIIGKYTKIIAGVNVIPYGQIHMGAGQVIHYFQAYGTEILIPSLITRIFNALKRIFGA